MKQNLKSEGAQLQGFIKIEHFDNVGNLMETVNTPNALMNLGFKEVAGLFNTDQAGSYTAFDYIAVGTGTTTATATDTTLETEETENGLARAAGTGTSVTESAVLNASSEGTMLCRQTFSAINVADGDTLQITWKVTVA